jgi:hypothetical protein
LNPAFTTTHPVQNTIMAQTIDKQDLAKAAADKLASGAFLKLEEVAALLDVAPITVHRLPLPSFRLGRVLRFDPQDVRRLIAQSKEAAL